MKYSFKINEPITCCTECPCCWHDGEFDIRYCNLIPLFTQEEDDFFNDKMNDDRPYKEVYSKCPLKRED